MLTSEGITLNSKDKVVPNIKTKLSKGMNINVIRVNIKTITESLPLNFKTVIKTDSSLPNTQKNIIQQGKTGEKQLTTNITYENGKEVSKKVISENIIKKPVDKIIVQGTLPIMPISRGGQTLSYSKVLQVKTTAYYAIYGVNNTYTASGMKAVRNSNGYSTVAVDPSVIPLGTKLFIENYGFAIAADTGTAIRGNKIDVYFNTRQEACNWAVKYVKVYVLK